MKKRYKVKLIFRYTNTIHVEAESPEEAEQKAIKECDDLYESYVDAEIEEEKS